MKLSQLSQLVSWNAVEIGLTADDAAKSLLIQRENDFHFLNNIGHCTVCCMICYASY